MNPGSRAGKPPHTLSGDERRAREEAAQAPGVTH